MQQVWVYGIKYITHCNIITHLLLIFFLNMSFNLNNHIDCLPFIWPTEPFVETVPAYAAGTCSSGIFLAPSTKMAASVSYNGPKRAAWVTLHFCQKQSKMLDYNCSNRGFWLGLITKTYGLCLGTTTTKSTFKLKQHYCPPCSYKDRICLRLAWHLLLSLTTFRYLNMKRLHLMSQM